MSKKDEPRIILLDEIDTPGKEHPFLTAFKARIKSAEQGYINQLRLYYGDEAVDRALAAEKDDAKDGC